MVVLKTRLEDGSRVAVIGGGPAGSLFAYFLLSYSRRERIDLRVDVFEWRSFSDKGPRGCNRCAGILSASLLKNLTGLKLTVPKEVIRERIASYHLHSPYGTISIDNPEPEAEILSVFRGGGPLHSPGEDIVGFDGFLLGKALELGARHLNHRIRRISMLPQPTMFLDGETMKYNLIILATGLNSGSVDIAGFPYSAPATLPIVIRELSARKDDIQEYFGNSVRAFLIPRSKLTFGTLVPKDGFVNTSLLGKNDPLDIEKFLEHETVRKVMPFDYKEACSCRPRIGIGMASNLYSDGFVAIGDAAVSRLYKDGMGSAFLTARQAAQTAIYYGTSMEAFRIHYAPLCNEIRKDNRLGHLLFAVHHQFKDSAYFFRAHLKLIESATSTPGVGQSFSRILWGMFTGSYTYREIWGMVKKPRTLLRLVIEFVREKMK